MRECDSGDLRHVDLRDNLMVSNGSDGIITEHDNILITIVRVMSCVNVAFGVEVCSVDAEGIAKQRTEQASSLGCGSVHQSTDHFYS